MHTLLDNIFLTYIGYITSNFTLEQVILIPATYTSFTLVKIIYLIHVFPVNVIKLNKNYL